ncbi:Cytochrome c family protein [hydrothermal vent metagenome]|uniref:Cytochrome c family protein n=1 Tax=hydrothermal vent metagenome TaxID=652676 RepID=A0A3B0Z977_9ZZZZ
MKRVKYISMVAAAVAMTAVASGSAFAMVDSDIKSTKHNLSTGAPAGNNQTDNGTTEICVFCHTPHGADITQSVPLWNRTMSDPTTFSTYADLGSATLDGSIGQVGSVSLACLSCHDGQIAMDSLLNAPGSGNPSTADWTFSGATMSSDGLLTSGIALVGLDLRNDHPVGILYAAGNVVGNETDRLSFTDIDFNPVEVTNINGANYWYVETSGAANGRDRADMILYTRTDVLMAVGGGTIDGAQPYVECASCHDPHVVAVGDQVSFLRISNEGSALCLACHIK